MYTNKWKLLTENNIRTKSFWNKFEKVYQTKKRNKSQKNRKTKTNLFWNKFEKV